MASMIPDSRCKIKLMILDWLFPKCCVGCGSCGGYFCPQCQAKIAQSELVCPNCERPAIGGITHPLCRKRAGLDGLWSLGVYQDPLKKAIQRLKYKMVRDLASTLADLLIWYWARYSAHFFEEVQKDPNSWVIVPVPLHPSRERWRGFNQSAVLAQYLAEKIGLQYREVLQRVKNTKPQVGLQGQTRHLNVRGAFALKVQYLLSRSNVLLVDDVWTTGSTLRECGYVLKKAGAGKVWALTLAR